MKASSIAKKLGVQPEEIEGMTRRLKAMERDGQLKQEKNGAYTLIAQHNLIVGG